jgi:uncharacterized protein
MKFTEIAQKTGAGCFIFEKESKKLLLIKRSSFVPVSDTWGIPAGKSEENETPLDTVKRELQEEIGLDSSNIQFLLIHKNQTHIPRFEFYTFACVVDEEFVPTLNWESSDYLWASTDDLPEPLHWGVEQTLRNKSCRKSIIKMFRSLP